MGQEQKDELSPQDKRKIKKLKMRVRHLDEELTQATDLKTEYDREFEEMTRQLRVFLGLEKDRAPESTQPPEPEKKKCNIDLSSGPNFNCGEPHSAKDEESYRHEIDNASSSAPAWMKKAYKQIAMKTHPDRIAQDKSLSPYEIAEYKRLFETAKNAIQEQNGGDLAYVAEQLNINSGIPATMRISLLYARAEKTKAKIDKIYRSPQWAWGEAHGNRKNQQRIIGLYCKLFKYKALDQESLDKFLDKLNIG